MTSFTRSVDCSFLHDFLLNVKAGFLQDRMRERRRPHFAVVCARARSRAQPRAENDTFWKNEHVHWSDVKGRRQICARVRSARTNNTLSTETFPLRHSAVAVGGLPVHYHSAFFSSRSDRLNEVCIIIIICIIIDYLIQLHNKDYSLTIV